jgi:TatD DNase family protein
MSSSYIDVHCHLDFPQIFENAETIVKNAREKGISIMVSNGVDPLTNRKTLELASRFKEIKPSLGFYPPDAWHKESNVEGGFKFDFSEFEKEIEFIGKNKDKIYAIGEVGLDYKDGQDKDLQKKVFVSMIRLAKEIGKPIIVHTRKAEEDAINTLEEEKASKVILHCFSGKKNLIERAAKLKYNFSIPTNVVRAENIQWMAKHVPLSQLFCETDSPFLSPFKEMQNEPAFVIESYKKIAELKGMTVEEVRNNIFMNYQRLF